MENSGYPERFREVGGAGFLLKDAGKHELVDAVRRIYGGEEYF